MADPSNFNVVSLFSGCGGMDYGFEGGFTVYGQYYEKNPFTTVFANDINQSACDTLHANMAHITPVCASINDIPDQTFIDLKKHNISVVTGGFPCQTFSHAGKREGLNSARGQLYKQMLRVVNIVRPTIFVAENVDGLRTTHHKGQTTALEHIVQEFSKSGYNVVYKVLKATDYGIPQTRVRIIIVGVRTDTIKTDSAKTVITAHTAPNFIFPPVTHGNGLRPYRTSHDAIEDLWGREGSTTIRNHSVKDYSKAKFRPSKKTQGNNQIVKNKPAPTIRAEHHGNIEGHYNTVDGKPLASDMSNIRRLSVRECARIQSFPDSFIFPSSASQAYRQIGNAVPPVLAWHIAQAVAQQLTQFH